MAIVTLAFAPAMGGGGTSGTAAGGAGVISGAGTTGGGGAGWTTGGRTTCGGGWKPGTLKFEHETSASAEMRSHAAAAIRA